MIDAALATLRTCRHGSDVDAIKAAISAVDHATADFAARRMDASIRKALQGQQIDKV